MSGDAPKQEPLVNSRRIQPIDRELRGRRRQEPVAAVAERIVLRPADQDRHGAVLERGKIFPLEQNEFRAPAQHAAPDGDKGAIAFASPRIGARRDRLVAECAREPEGLLLSPGFGTSTLYYQ